MTRWSCRPRLSSLATQRRLLGGWLITALLEVAGQGITIAKGGGAVVRGAGKVAGAHAERIHGQGTGERQHRAWPRLGTGNSRPEQCLTAVRTGGNAPRLEARGSTNTVLLPLHSGAIDTRSSAFDQARDTRDASSTPWVRDGSGTPGQHCAESRLGQKGSSRWHPNGISNCPNPLDSTSAQSAGFSTATSCPSASSYANSQPDLVSPPSTSVT